LEKEKKNPGSGFPVPGSFSSEAAIMYPAGSALNRSRGAKRAAKGGL